MCTHTPRHSAAAVCGTLRSRVDMGLGHAFLGCPCPAGGDGDKGLKEGAAGRPGCRGASGRVYRSLGGEEEHLAREPLWDTKPGGQPLCAQPGGSLAAGHGEGRGLAWPSSWVGCPLSTPIPWWADQWEMMEHQVPCWCHSPHPPPFAAPQTDSPWHKVGGGHASTTWPIWEPALFSDSRKHLFLPLCSE